jgi:hypothetical protein
MSNVGYEHRYQVLAAGQRPHQRNGRELRRLEARHARREAKKAARTGGHHHG